MKKLICLLTTLLLLVSCFYVSAAAEEVPTTGETPAEETTVLAGSTSDYDRYLVDNANLPDATDSIVVEGGSYSSQNGAVLEKDKENFTNAIRWTNGEGTVTYKIKVKETALYSLRFYYEGIKNRSNPITVSVKLDGEYPYGSLENIELPRVWKDSGEVRSDGVGNEFTAEQVEVITPTNSYATDASGLVSTPLVIALTAGEHTVEVTALEEPFVLDKFVLGAPVKYPSYEEVKQSYADKGYTNYTGDKTIVIQGEKADFKSTNSLIAKSDSSDPSVQPSNPYVSKINYIGSSNWSTPGDRLTWKFTVEETGLYKLGIKFRQGTILNGNSYRRIYIDGEVPFEEASNVSFSYASGWQYKELGKTDDKGNVTEYYLFYLEEGEHTFEMDVTIGELADLTRALEAVTYSAGNTYRKIVQITGETPDASRDYDLFEQIPNLEETLQRDMDELYRISYALEDLYGSTGGTNATSIRTFAQVMKNMLKFPYDSHQYVSLYYTNYTSVSALVYEMMSLPLDLDYVVFSAAEKEVEGTTATFWEQTSYSFDRFLSSFSSTYNSVSGSVDSDRQITLWVNWGRDQVRVLNDLIQSSFTPETGIGVNVQISNASYIQAILSGNGPDCSLHMARSEPVNLALRGAMIDLKPYIEADKEKYENGETDSYVLDSFISEDALVPYQFQGGVYALPDTQGFNMLYYRTDVFEEMGIEKVPETWDEFIYTSSKIMRSNYAVGMPYVQITSSTQTNVGVASLSIFPTLLMQKNHKLYNDSLDGLALTDATAIETFEWWTQLYTEYKFPITYNFFNRFRLGTMPMGIVGYTYYAQLTLAAPEIAGKWEMAEIPGTVQADGSINKLQAGSGTGCGILKVSKNPDLGWEFLKWWVSADTQLRYSNNCESILGVSGRVTTSNPEALKQMAWDKQSLERLLAQWNNLREVEEVPGGYYTGRILDQAYWNVVNNGKNSKDMIIKWAGYGDAEIQRKRNEYGLN